MDKSLTMMIVGVIMIVAGLIAVAAGVMTAADDPREKTVETLIFEKQYFSLDDGMTKTINLSSGEYEIWYETELFDYRNPGEMSVLDSSGTNILKTTSAPETITIMDSEYKKVGTFEVKSSGVYDVAAQHDSTVFITTPLNVATGFGICAAGIIIGIVGGILLLVGIILFATRKKKDEQPPYPGYPGYPSQQPGQYPGYPPQHPSQNTGYPPQQQPPSQQPHYPPK